MSTRTPRPPLERQNASANISTSTADTVKSSEDDIDMDEEEVDILLFLQALSTKVMCIHDVMHALLDVYLDKLDKDDKAKFMNKLAEQQKEKFSTS